MSRSRQVSVYVDVDLGEFDTNDLVEEIRARGSPRSDGDQIIEEAYRALMNGKTTEAICGLERYLFPKWRSPLDCLAEYKRVKAADEPV